MKKEDRKFQRRDIVWAMGPTKQRPFLIVNNEKHPFHDEEYISVGITTTERQKAIEIENQDCTIGELSKKTYISPWFLATIKHESIDRGIAKISKQKIKQTYKSITTYIEDI